MASRLSSLLGLSLLTAFAGAAPERGHDLAVPGGLRGLLEAAGLDPGTEHWRALPALVRRLHPLNGPSPPVLPRVLAHLEGSLPESEGVERLELPLAREFWDRVFFPRALSDHDRLRALLADRRASLLARGLLALDDETLAALAQDPGTVSRLYERHAAAFAAFASCLHVRGGVVQLPGGPESAPLWGLPREVSPPGPLLRALFSADNGRRAWLFDTVARADPPHRAFLLGTSTADPSPRAQRLASLCGAFAKARAWWLTGRPRHLADPAFVLLNVGVTPKGELAGPDSRGFWDAVFSGRETAGREDGQPTDAAWLVERVGLAAAPVARERLQRLLFAQRFLEAHPGLEPGRALSALRLFATAPSLALTLEQLGPAPEAAYAAGARSADQLSELGDTATAATGLAQLQGALALVARARWSRALRAETAVGLAVSLLGVPLGKDGAYHGAIALWIERQLLPSLSAAVGGPPEAAEQVVARAVSGMTGEAPAAPLVRWEGLLYRVDPSLAEKLRFEAARRQQQGPALDEVLAFERAARATTEGGEGAERAPGAGAGRPASPERPRLEAPVSARGSATREPGGAGPARDPDMLLGATLIALVYAAHAAAPELATLADRHEFFSAASSREARARSAWALPDAIWGAGRPWRLRGSLLGLDAGLALSALKHLRRELPERAPVVDPGTARMLALGAALMSPFALRDADRDAVAGALLRGRARIARVCHNHERGDTILELLVAEGEGRAARCARGLDDGVQAERLFSLAELASLGDRPAPPACDAWGALALPRGGPLCLQAPPPRPWSDLTGTGEDGLPAARLMDPALRALDALAELGLPASLAPAVVGRIVQDVIDGAEPVDREDGATLERFAATLSRERIEDAIASLAVAGPLVPVQDPGGARF
ncbi:MAG TPA: hypothetical protein VN461_04935 [Vicinamibacteria bacterium]|nr:hypothetical protein [Vicinamibacteria bacterium]